MREIRKNKGAAIAIYGDISKEEDVKAMFKQMFEEFGTIDILVNNAGIQKDSDFVDMSFQDWQKVISVNLSGGFLCAREAAKEFIRRNTPSRYSECIGRIIFISSVHQAIPWAGHCNYAASKGGVMMLMKTLAQELAPHKIRVNAVAPGAIETTINKSAWSTPEKRKKLLTFIPYNRIGDADDVANTVIWLASDESDYVQGATIFVDGGMMLYPGFARGG